jgi:hypothetical protein
MVRVPSSALSNLQVSYAARICFGVKSPGQQLCWPSDRVCHGVPRPCPLSHRQKRWGPHLKGRSTLAHGSKGSVRGHLHTAWRQERVAVGFSPSRWTGSRES